MAPTWLTRYEISWVSAHHATNRRPTLGGGRCSPSAAGTVSATPSPTALPECRAPPPLKSIYTCDDSNFSKDCLYLEFAGPVLNVSSTVMINRLSQDKKKSILQLKKRSLPDTIRTSCALIDGRIPIWQEKRPARSTVRFCIHRPFAMPFFRCRY